MSQKGQTLIELLITIALAAILIPALLTGFSLTREGRAQQEQRLQATAYLKEGQEAVRIVHSNGWNNLTNGTYYPEISGSTWTLTSGSENINSNLSRQIEISDVYRDSGGDIVQIGGILDPSTKKVETTVSWNTPLPTNVGSIVYLTRNKNSSYVDTTQGDFEGGVLNDAIVTNTSGGEVTLGAGGGGNWCTPAVDIVGNLDLPKNGDANAISAYEGRIIAGTGNNSSGVSLADVSVTNDNPPVASLIGTFDGYKTNDVYLDGNYAYLATDKNSKEVVIIDLTTYQEVGYYNTPFSNANATSVFVSGNVGYVTSNFFLYSFDLSSKTGSRPTLTFDFFLGSATSVFVNGGYAYVSLSNSSIEMQIIDVSNPAFFTKLGYADVNGTDGERIFVNQTGTRAYLATNSDPSKDEFFIIDISGKTGSRPIVGSYDASGMSPADLSVVPGNKALLVGSGGEEYQVLEISDENNPIRCGGMEINTGIKGVVGVLELDGDAFSYIVTGDSSAELKIIAGGPGGQFTTSGDFTSRVFDATVSAAFNRFIPSFTQPPNTTIDFQVAVASGNCSTAIYDFIGPDGTSNTYFATSSAIPLITAGNYNNPSRCFKYKAFLNTNDILASPILNDITVNYSL